MGLVPAIRTQTGLFENPTYMGGDVQLRICGSDSLEISAANIDPRFNERRCEVRQENRRTPMNTLLQMPYCEIARYARLVALP